MLNGMWQAGTDVCVRTVAGRFYHRAAGAWLDATQDYSPFEVAVACRLHAQATAALRLGRIDTPRFQASRVLRIAASPQPWGVARDASKASVDFPGPLAPRAVFKATLAFARRALVPWGPATHDLYHRAFRQRVAALLMVANRLAVVAANNNNDDDRAGT